MPTVPGRRWASFPLVPTHNLVVGGTADISWQAGFRCTGQVLEIEGADHSLEVADWRTSVQQHEAVAAAVAHFAAGVAG